MSGFGQDHKKETKVEVNVKLRNQKLGFCCTYVVIYFNCIYLFLCYLLAYLIYSFNHLFLFICFHIYLHFCLFVYVLIEVGWVG